MLTPDTKDWTWVLDRSCPECGFDATTFTREEVPAMLRRNAAEWPALLAGDAARRPTPEKWSPLEYACHVRDVCRIYAERLHLMRTEDGPHYPNWDQDRPSRRRRAVHHRVLRPLLHPRSGTPPLGRHRHA